MPASEKIPASRMRRKGDGVYLAASILCPFINIGKRKINFIEFL